MTQTDIANLALTKLGDLPITDIDATTDKGARLARLHYEPCLREVLRAHFWGFAMGAVDLSAKTNDSAPACAILNPAGANNAILLTAVDSGSAGNGLSGQILAATTGAISVAVTDGALTVAPLSGSTAADVIEAINADAAAKLLFVASNSGTDTGVGTLDPVAKTFLSGGVDMELLAWASAFDLPSDFIKLRAVFDSAGTQIDKFDLRRVLGTRCLVAGDWDTVQLDYVQFVDQPEDWDPLFTAALVTLLASRMARAITGSDGMESNLRQIYETVDLPAARCADGHDTQSGENHPLRDMLNGALTLRGDFFSEMDD